MSFVNVMVIPYMFLYLYADKFGPALDEYYDSARKRIIKLCLLHYFEDFKFYLNRQITPEIILSSHLLKADNVRGKNLLEVKYNGINFLCQETTASVKNFPIFRGIWIAIETKFRMNGFLQIVETGGISYVTQKPSDYMRINTESIRFNERLEVYSSSEQLAFYILTPQIIEILLKIRNMEGKLLMGFSNGYLHIALFKNKKFFNVIFNQSTYEQTDRILKECKLIKSVLKELTSIENKLIQQPPVVAKPTEQKNIK